jgi:deoxyribodipyrimidine photo-lyase
MRNSKIEPARVRALNSGSPASGDYVLYWMQAAQRTECNHALELVIELANERQQKLRVYFGLTSAFPEANARHYAFSLKALTRLKTICDKEESGWRWLNVPRKRPSWP